MNADSNPFLVGQEWDHTFLILKNSSNTTVRLKRAVPTQAVGLGSVAAVVKTEAAPHGPVPSALFHTLAPVFSSNGQCLRQTLLPLHGAVLPPHSDMFILTVLRALKPGKFHYSGYNVEYTEAGTTYQQYIPIGYVARVAAGVQPNPLESWEKPCAKPDNTLPPLGTARP